MISRRMSMTLQQLAPSLSGKSGAVNGEIDVVDLSTADNQLLQPELYEIFQIAIAEEDKKKLFSRPATFGGDIEARIALAGFFNSYFHPTVQLVPEHIVLTAGAGNGIEALVQSICDEGDSVIIPVPFWYGFEPYITGRPKVNIIAARPGSNADHAEGLISALESAFAEASEPSKVKAVIMTNPHNPFSRCYPKSVLIECLTFCSEKGLHVIFDELYALSAFGPAGGSDQPNFISSLSIASLGVQDVELDRSHIHVVWSPSKLFGLSGLRIGCVISQHNPAVRAAVSLLEYATSSSLSTATLKSLLKSRDLPVLLKLNSERLSESYDIFAKGLGKLGVDFIPASEGLFVFARISKRLTSKEEEIEFMEGLEQHGLRVSPGWMYDPSAKEFGWARITIAVPSDQATEGMLRLHRYLNA